MNFGPYSKSVNATAIALVGTLVVVLADGHISLADGLTLAINTLTAAIFITLTKNTERFRVAKLVMTVLITGIGSVLASVQAGLDFNLAVVLTAVLAILNGFTTYNITEAGESTNIEA